jgi:formylglycine-generating enzyme required for sulfatase activity/tRNA A-37 threonylcarbamoyl transferase component Bud32
METVDTFGLVGTTIADKYVVEAVADAGGTAIVYRAFHRLWKRPVALKVFRTPGNIGEDVRAALVERFVLEGRLLAELSERSPAVLQARDIGTLTAPTGEWVPYMVLEWLDGATLERVLEDEAAKGLPTRTLAEAMTLLDPIAQALELAHRRGIVHRDVKPANVFVVGDARGPDVVLKLLDFGIAKVVEDARGAGAFGKTGVFTAFTPAYGAPEQFSRAIGTTGPWTDVFALALVLLELVSGRAPLAGDTIEELGVASTRGDLRPSLARLKMTRSADVEAVFARAVAVEPSARYASVEAFWSELRRVMTRAPSTPAPSAPAPSTPAPRAPSGGLRRTRWAAAAALAVLVPLGAAAVVVTVRTTAGTSASAAAVRVPAVAAVAASAPAVVAPSCAAGMVMVPASTFFMGSDERDVEPDERPAHKVRLDAYCIDRTEVTVASYAACVASGACSGRWDANEWPGIAKSDRAAFDGACNARAPASRGQHPANCVSWMQAHDYCASVGARLPTEAEWELAARGTDGRRYPWGDAEPTSSRLNACGAECLAWGKKRGVELAAMYRDDDGWPTTAPAGSFPAGASPFGALDMTGNVWEWVEDRHGPYEAAESVAPTGPAVGDERVLRGGAWNGSDSAWVRPTFRFSASPAMQSHGIGFRCAQPLVASADAGGGVR